MTGHRGVCPRMWSGFCNQLHKFHQRDTWETNEDRDIGKFGKLEANVDFQAYCQHFLNNHQDEPSMTMLNDIYGVFNNLSNIGNCESLNMLFCMIGVVLYNHLQLYLYYMYRNNAL